MRHGSTARAHPPEPATAGSSPLQPPPATANAVELVPPPRRARFSGSPHHADALSLVRTARAPIAAHERQAVYDMARVLCVLALTELLAADAPCPSSPARSAPQLAGALVSDASHARLAVLLETTPARDAHAIVSALARASLVPARTAQIAHLRIDLRDAPD